MREIADIVLLVIMTATDANIETVEMTGTKEMIDGTTDALTVTETTDTETNLETDVVTMKTVEDIDAIRLESLATTADATDMRPTTAGPLHLPIPYHFLNAGARHLVGM